MTETPADSPRPAVFVDKDDTIVRDVPYNACPALIEWVPGAITALRRLSEAGFEIVLVTNQSGVAKGRFTERELERYFERLREMLASEGVRVASIEYCPHHPHAALPRYRRFCSCRKPNPGMLARAAARHGFDLSRSWMVGDLLDDIEAGARAGCRTALIAVHEDQAPPRRGLRRPDLLAPSLEVAVQRILAAKRRVA